MDENAFPAAFQIGTESVCLPYIAGTIRLADGDGSCAVTGTVLFGGGGTDDFRFIQPAGLENP